MLVIMLCASQTLSLILTTTPKNRHFHLHSLFGFLWDKETHPKGNRKGVHPTGLRSFLTLFFPMINQITILTIFQAFCLQWWPAPFINVFSQTRAKFISMSFYLTLHTLVNTFHLYSHWNSFTGLKDLISSTRS